MPRRLLSLAVMIGLMFASAAMAFDSWPQWRGPNRDGISAEKGLLDHWDKAPPLLWKTQGLGNGDASVVIDKGLVCTLGDRNGKTVVFAFRDKDGKEAWATEIDDAWRGAHRGPKCTPTIDGERLYAISPHGILVCLKTATGELVW